MNREQRGRRGQPLVPTGPFAQVAHDQRRLPVVRVDDVVLETGAREPFDHRFAEKSEPRGVIGVVAARRRIDIQRFAPEVFRLVDQQQPPAFPDLRFEQAARHRRPGHVDRQRIAQRFRGGARQLERLIGRHDHVDLMPALGQRARQRGANVAEPAGRGVRRNFAANGKNPEFFRHGRSPSPRPRFVASGRTPDTNFVNHYSKNRKEPRAPAPNRREAAARSFFSRTAVFLRRSRIGRIRGYDRVGRAGRARSGVVEPRPVRRQIRWLFPGLRGVRRGGSTAKNALIPGHLSIDAVCKEKPPLLVGHALFLHHMLFFFLTLFYDRPSINPCPMGIFMKSNVFEIQGRKPR